MTTLILIILPTMFGILFFYLGMYQERIGWNKLIEKGTLPKPIQEGKTKSNTKPFTGKGRQAPPPFHSETRTMTQTAVEWQFEQLFNSFEKFNNGECTFNDYLKRNLEIRKQAKEMEREQREADFIAGYEKRAELSNLLFDKISEQSAKELFKQQKE